RKRRKLFSNCGVHPAAGVFSTAIGVPACAQCLSARARVEEGTMVTSWKPLCSMFIVPLIAMGVLLGYAKAPAPAPAKPPALDPAALVYQSPDQIKWTSGAGGNSQAVLYGDPTKPGLYIILNKWSDHHNSRPHFHPNDRFITVLSGTWWVNT